MSKLFLPEAQEAKGESVPCINFKEFTMSSKTSSPELQQALVDLGDAKALTQGIPAQVYAEDNPLVQGKDEA